MSYETGSFDARATELLGQGGVGFMPSDTIYGLSCRALDEAAVKRVHGIKERDEHKPFIVLVADINMLNLLSIDPKNLGEAVNFWPGPLTIICEAPAAPQWLQLGTNSLAVRLPARLELLKLIRQVGPIISTSANRQGQDPLMTVAEAKRVFAGELDFYVDQGEIRAEPSTIVKPTAAGLQVIRPGAVKISDKERRL